MNIPTDCPYAANPPLGLRDADRRVECCRPPRWGSRIVWEEQAVSLTRKILKAIEPDNERIEATPREDVIASAADIWAEEPLCRTMRTETEVCRFTWRSSFDGDAVVRIGRQGDEITLRCACRRFSLSEREPRVVPLARADWDHLQDALIAASFWALDPNEGPLARGLDGSDWRFEGRRKDIFRAVSRWSPDGAIYDLGRLFVRLAGPPLAEVSLY